MNIFDFLSSKKLVIKFEDNNVAPGPTPTPTPTPEPGPGPTPTPGPSSGYDLTTHGCLQSTWATVLDPVGPADQIEIGPATEPFAYVPPGPFSRFSWCRKWQGCLTAPADGDYLFSATIKSAGYIIFDSDIAWSRDREDDPGNHSQFTVTFTKSLKRGQQYPVEILFRCQSGEHVFLLSWQKPGDIGPSLVDSLYFSPPNGWQPLLKKYNPPAPPPPGPTPTPGPGPDVNPQPDWSTYKTPDMPVTLLAPDSPWLQNISAAPVDPNSDKIIAAQPAHVHPEFGFGMNGIPYQIIPVGTAKVSVVFDIPDESDVGPYPIPSPPILENGTPGPYDYHWIGLSVEDGKFYEIYNLRHESGVWKGYAGAIWDIGKNTTRPLGWTSADGAGLPMLPGLIRYEEVLAGKISHAIRFTVGRTMKGFTAPASHYASTSTDTTLPPMGARFRLKASVDISAVSPQAKVVLQALKDYGMIVADNGSNGFLFVGGSPDSRWNDNDLASLKNFHTSDFEVIQMGQVVTSI